MDYDTQFGYAIQIAAGWLARGEARPTSMTEMHGVIVAAFKAVGSAEEAIRDKLPGPQVI